MTHKTDMREALQLCIDAMLHDGVPTNPYHPRQVALAAAEAARAAAPQAEAAQEQVGKAEPIAWIRFCGDGLYEGPIMNCDRRKMDEIVRVKPDEWRALVLRNDSTQENGCLTRKSMQEKALEHGFEYWRAPDEHGITGTKPQCIEFLQDLLGVEVEIEDNGCQTCNGTGMIGGPSFYAPDEGGEPCPDCCDTPSYCSSVRRCTAQDAEQPSECVEQECPHGVDDGACKQCYGEAVSGEHWAQVELPERVIDKLFQAAGVSTCGPDGEDILDNLHAFARNVVAETLARLPASAPTLGEPVPLRDIRMLAGYAEGSKSPRMVNAFRRVMRWLDDAPAVAQPQAAEPKGMTDEQRFAALQAEIDRLNAIINTPQSGDFLRAVSVEAEHQRQRWGSTHDVGKTPADWFWLVGYLGGKALHSHAAGNIEKAEHHIITTAAACQNWHRNMFGDTGMRPGIDGEAALLAKGE